LEHRRELVLGRKLHDLFRIPAGQHIRDHEERVGAVRRHRRDGAVDICGLLHPQGLYGHAQHRCRRLNLAEDVGHERIARIPQHGHTPQAAHRLFQQLEPFPC
jgi:hypothetical protein